MGVSHNLSKQYTTSSLHDNYRRSNLANLFIPEYTLCGAIFGALLYGLVQSLLVPLLKPASTLKTQTYVDSRFTFCVLSFQRKCLCYLLVYSFCQCKRKVQSILCEGRINDGCVSTVPGQFFGSVHSMAE